MFKFKQKAIYFTTNEHHFTAQNKNSSHWRNFATKTYEINSGSELHNNFDTNIRLTHDAEEKNKERFCDAIEL